MSPFRSDLFAGRVALLTGGGTGITRGIAEALAAHGAGTVLLSRKADHVHTAAREIAHQFKTRCLGIEADVRHPEAMETAAAQAVKELGRLDILVNGAAGNFPCASADLTPNGFAAVVDIDVKGTWHASRAAFQAWMKEHGGSILNISATLHYGGTPGQLHVTAAKAAIDAMTRTLAVEWGPLGIRTNAIAPGPIADTEGVRRLLPGEAAERFAAVVPTRRMGTIDDIAMLALFVLSDAGSNLNGAIIPSDGGLCLAGNMGFAFTADSARPRP
ncbi:MAG TPA: SDR family oxidoreductase [Isosphaeraceae bacterium]|jgi:peroxisomal 2,4-dienoyl-CoA reductase